MKYIHSILVIIFVVVIAFSVTVPTQAAVNQSTYPTDFSTRGVIVLENSTASLYIVHPIQGTTSDTPESVIEGPFLNGELGSEGGGVFDVAVTPDGKTAIISNFGDSTVFFVDISDLSNPYVIGNYEMSYFAEDIVISPDGKYALITDGGFSPAITTLDIRSRSLVEEFTMPTDTYGNSVDVAPDGTVIVSDYFSGYIHTLVLDKTGHLTFANSYGYTVYSSGDAVEGKPEVSVEAVAKTFRPINTAIAPDGQTVLVFDTTKYTPDLVYPALYDVGVYQITDPGVLVFKTAITGLTRTAQSATFNDAGTIAYLNGNNGQEAEPVDDVYYPDQVMTLSITAPGEVSLQTNAFADLGRNSGSQWFGVDTITVSQDMLVVSNCTASITDEVYQMAIVDLNNNGIQYITTSGPTSGVAAIPILKTYIPVSLK